MYKLNIYWTMLHIMEAQRRKSRAKIRAFRLMGGTAKFQDWDCTYHDNYYIWDRPDHHRN